MKIFKFSGRGLAHLPQVIGISLLTGMGVSVARPVEAVSLDLTRWDTLGDVGTVTSGRANLSTDGLNDDDFDLGVGLGHFNFSGQPAAPIGSGNSPLLEDFLGIDVTQLDLDEAAYEGSALKTTISVNAGDILSFEWQFLTNETATLSPLGPFNDYGFFLVEGQVIKLADVDNALSFSDFFAAQTAVQTYSHRFSQRGTYTIAFGVIDVRDYPLTSALSVRNVTQQTSEPSVDESDSLRGILALGLLGMVALIRRGSKKKNQK